MAATFSIIVPTCRRPALLARALASVRAQVFCDFECIVVDDGGDVAPDLPDDQRFRLVRHPRNLGLPTALNTGLDDATGQFVTFLDDDDELTADRLSMVVPVLGRSDAVLCWATADHAPLPVNRELDGRVYDTILDTRAPPKGTVVVGRDLMPRFDTRYHALEDLEWWLRAADALSVVTVPRVGYVIHRHSGPRTTNGPVARVRCGQMLLRERADYFRTHRRAAALRWLTVGVTSEQLGDNRLARRALVRSVRARPSVAAARGLVRSLTPSRTSITGMGVAPEADADSARRY